MLAGIAIPAAIAPVATHAEAGPSRSYDLPAQPLSDALLAVGRASGWEVMVASSDVAGRQAPPLKGMFTIRQAMDALLEGSDLGAEVGNGTVIIRGRTQAPGPVEPDPATSSEGIVVTCSRIRGAAPTSPVVSVSREAMRDAGQSDLGEAMRSVPQNFSGGQNPGVAIGNFPNGSFNLNSASSLNLRGLGPDATLTLLNGRRLAYGGAGQSVDISTIPIDAVDRVEIVADGASALYGSDAVGGVANVILNRDYDGAAVSARWGAATDGGDVQQQYGAVVGQRWSTGGVIATYDYAHSTAIKARQRDYTVNLDDTSTLYPFRESHSALLSAHQELGEAVTLSLDTLFNRRRHRVTAPFTTTAPFDFFGSDARARTTSFAFAPSLEVEVAPGWSIRADFVHGLDRTHYSTLVAVGGVKLYDTHGCYCNTLTSAELSADGKLLDLPAGAIRVALGGGYRRNALDYSRARSNFRPITTPTQRFHASQESVYAYGEIHIPLVSPEMDVPWVERFSVTGALRYERYRGMDEVVTPKIGAVFAPTPDFEFKASWGKSFKAPTLYQQYLSQDAYLYDVEGFGSGYPAGSTVLYRGGGNPDLEPEHATNWTATLGLHPRALAGFDLALSTFAIRYRSRVIEPITSAAGVLDNPLFRDLVILAPSLSEIDEAVASAAMGLTNNSSGAFDPANVVAIIDNRFRNVARQRVKGVDLSFRYRHQWESGESLTFTGSASYIDSRQQLIRGQASSDLAGTLFNPPHLRARGGLVWNGSGLTLAAFVSHIGGVTDKRQEPHEKIGGQTPIDLTLRYRTDEGEGLLSGLELAVSAQNIFNDKPSLIRTASAHFTPYDSTNYSPVGRFVSLSATKRW